YMLSKFLGEQMCARFSAYHGMTTVCLRPPWVATDETLRSLQAAPATPDFERRADWNFGTWVHVDDVAAAVASSLTCPQSGHVVLLLSARDSSSVRTTRELLDSLYSDIPWRGPELD